MSNQQIQKVKVKRLAHVGLWVNDVPTQTRFYRQVLGFNLHPASEGVAHQEVELEDANIFLSLGESQYSLGLFNDTRPHTSNGRRAVPRTPLHHISFEVDTHAELAALAARLKLFGLEVSLSTREGDPDQGDTLWLNDPDGNRVEISVTPDDLLMRSAVAPRGRMLLQPSGLQHISLYTPNLESMVEFYTEALGFDISDWLLRECAWLRCNIDHHSLVFMQGKPAIDHIGFRIADGTELLRWADHLSYRQVPVLWGPGRHGAGNDLFLRCSDTEGNHIELSAELQQYYDREVTTPPRLWHTRAVAFNLWGTQPSWIHEEVKV
ncbi:MAG TPA: VOC family protein [Ktedonosporobacter sp.]|nr:VOC family protein [Ktedonosporobacter sp.]